MKRRLALSFTIGFAVILIGSLAYAADRKKQTKLVEPVTDEFSEELALKAELLEALKDNKNKLPDAGAAVKVTRKKSNDNSNKAPARK